MIAKLKEKQKAIKLRKKGFCYSEILKEVPVAKSTLSLWLQDVGLAKKQKQRLTEKKKKAQQRGAEARKEQRIILTKKIKHSARKEIGEISKRDLWIAGIALYWAEGAKERRKAAQVTLGNTDPYLIKIFLKWLIEICQISESEINFRICLHKNSKNRLAVVRKYWSRETDFPIENFNKVSWKEHNIKSNRTNIGDNYFGLLEIRVSSSANLNRKIAGWIEGIYEHS